MSTIEFINKISNRIFWAYHMGRSALIYRIMFHKFGRKSLIIRPTLISNSHKITVGNRVLIRNGARIEIVLDGVNNPEILIGDNVNIEQNVHIVCHCSVIIGSNVSITANCSIVDTTHPFDNIADDVKVGAHISAEPSFVEIGDGCFIGIGTSILPNVRIGKNSIIGSHSVVTRDIPAYSVAVGQPAKVIRTRHRLAEENNRPR